MSAQVIARHATPEVVKQLTGHSGCRVLLCRAGDEYFVRKSSGSDDYNPRLLRQADKQSRLSALVPTPRVFQRGIQGGLAFFDMEYVSGHDFRTYAPLQNVASISEFAQKVFGLLGRLAATADGLVDVRRFKSKAEDVSRAVEASPFYKTHAEVLGAATRHLRTADWSGIPRTDSHGDFTLENILVKEDGGLVLIDLLDGDLESVWLDAAKLLHDLHTGWSLRSILWKPEPTAGDRLLIMLGRYLLEEVQVQVASTFPEIRRKLSTLRLLQGMRVLPYVRDDSTFDHVVRGLAPTLR